MSVSPNLVTLPAAALKFLLIAARAVRNSNERVAAAGYVDLDQDRTYQALCGAIGLAEDALGLAPEEVGR